MVTKYIPLQTSSEYCPGTGRELRERLICLLNQAVSGLLIGKRLLLLQQQTPRAQIKSLLLPVTFTIVVANSVPLAYLFLTLARILSPLVFRMMSGFVIFDPNVPTFLHWSSLPHPTIIVTGVIAIAIVLVQI